MFEKILLHTTDPRGVENTYEGTNRVTVGNARTDILVDGEFIGIQHGEFKYDTKLGWLYVDTLDAHSPTKIISANGKSRICTKGKPLLITTGDELILNKLVKIRVLRALNTSGKL